FFPVLRREPGAEERYLTGENLRGYFDRLGRTEHPVGIAASGEDGYSVDDHTRPAAPSIPANLHSYLLQRMEQVTARAQSLQGNDGRAQIMSDRMHDIADTSMETKMVTALGPHGYDALQFHFDVAELPPNSSPTDPDLLDQLSPFRGNFLSSI